MANRKYMALAVLLGVIGCASTSFPYKFYGINADSYGGSLLGPTPADDIPFAQCSPDPEPSPSPSGAVAVKGKCVVMKADAFFSLKLEFQQMQLDLQQCQSPQPR